MCGIAGFIAPENRAQNATVIRSMAHSIQHRGPDDEGFFERYADDGNYQVHLAHRRLAIIDLHSGHQPMCNEDGRVSIVFNGEIYNYRALRCRLIELGHVFKTDSDTETIIHAYEEYGEQCVDHLRGMFAFAIWDARNESLFIARDRFGKKPLFFAEQDGVFLFASEIKALLQFPGIKREVDLTAVWHYLSYRYVPAPLTMFKGVQKLLSGHYLVWKNGHITIRQYYTPPDYQPFRAGKVIADPVAEFMALLEESVHLRMVSDVSFGAFLSGGIDSSAIVGLMARHSELPVKTFSVGFSALDYSELGYAKTIANHFKTEHHELIISEKHLVDALPALTRYRDAPVSNVPDIPIYLLSLEAGKSVKMVLTGEGSDEFLGGYPKHRFESYVKKYQLLPRFVRNSLIEPFIQSLPYKFRRAKTAIHNLGIEEWSDRMARWFGALSASERQVLVAFSPDHAEAHWCRSDLQQANSPLRRILCFDQTSWLPDNLLERGDRMTMAASIEARMPFMDHKLAAFISSLPDDMRIRNGTSKWILRESMKQLLPGQIIERPKVGFRAPYNEWFKGSMKDYLFDHLTGEGCRTSAYYNRSVLEKYLHEHVAGRQNHEKVLWAMLTLEIWHREFNMSA